MTPSDSVNDRKLRIATLSRPILDAYRTQDPLAIQAVHAAATGLVNDVVSLVNQLAPSTLPTTPMSATSPGPKCKDLREAGLVLGGGVIRQSCYQEVVLSLLRDRGIEFGVVETVKDVAGEGVMGLVAKARARR